MVELMELIINQRNYLNERLRPEIIIQARQQLLQLNKTSSIEEIEFLSNVINTIRSGDELYDTLINGIDVSFCSKELSLVIISLYTLKNKATV